MKYLCLFAGALLWVGTQPVAARTWTSLNGDYKINGEALAYNESTVIIKRDGSGRIVAVELAELSAEDRDFIQQKLEQDQQTASQPELHTWTSKTGLKLRGEILAYGRRTITIARTRGVVTIDGKAFSALDPIHQRLLLRVVSELEGQELADAGDLGRWVHSLGGQPKSYTLEGVLMKLESGDEIPIPFFLFSDEDLQILRPGWESWLAAEADQQARAREDLLVQNEARQYQRQLNQDAERQRIEVLKLNMLAAASGLTSIWEVGLIPGPGTYGRPTTVMVTARNSELAAAMALQQHPGYELLGVRRANR